MLRVDDQKRIRVLTLDRPDALNAFNDAMFDAATDALLDAASAPVAVVVITGAGRAFSAGADLGDMSRRNAGERRVARHGFPGFVEALLTFPKPLLCAVNGVAVGIGATMLAYADLVFISTEARIRCPFTRLGVAPEAGSSVTFPWLLGRQQAAWALLSSEWLSADDCVRMGLAWKACSPVELLADTLRHADVLASKPISSLVASKQLLVAPLIEQVRAARAREDAAFKTLLGAPANVEALRAFAERRDPDFGALDD